MDPIGASDAASKAEHAVQSIGSHSKGALPQMEFVRNLVFHNYLGRLLSRCEDAAGGRGPLVELEDLGMMPQSLRPTNVVKRYQALQSQHRRLRSALPRLFWRRWVCGGALYVLWCCSAGGLSFALRLLLDALGDSQVSLNQALACCGLILVCYLAYNISINLKFSLMSLNSVAVQNLLMALLFEKAFRLDVRVTSETVGLATNLMANDTEQIFEFLIYSHYLVLSPLFVLVILIFASSILGYAALVGFGFLLCAIIPFQAALGIRVSKWRAILSRCGDRRTGAFSGVLHGILVLKAYGWEGHAAYLIQNFRLQELLPLKYFNALKSSSRLSLWIAPGIVVFVVSTTEWLIDEAGDGSPFSLRDAMLLMGFVSVCRFPLMLIPQAYTLLGEAIAALNRVEEFLNLPEAPGLHSSTASADSATCDNDHHIHDVRSAEEPMKACWALRDVAFSFVSEPGAWAVHVSMDVSRGRLTAVVGEVGCGKTALLLGLLGELPARSGCVRRFCGPGVAYSAQGLGTVFSGSLRDNVLFGLPYHEAAYERCLNAACLDTDIAAWGPQGDLTEIGERGIMLSGGQSSRVSFARCLYRAIAPVPNLATCEAVVLDDPFAAVDLPVASRMFRGLDLLRGKTVVLVLSAPLHLLRWCDEVLLLPPGGALAQPPQSLTEVAAECDWLREALLANDGTTETDALPAPAEAAQGTKTKPGQLVLGATKSIALGAKSDVSASRILKEEREVGRVGWRAWVAYFSWQGNANLIISSVALLYIIGQGLRVVADLWLLWWATGEVSTKTGEERIIWWALLLVGNVILAACRSMITAAFSARASCALHNQVLGHLLRARVAHFFANPPGRLLNKFSSDVAQIDTQLPEALYIFLDNTLVLISAGILGAIASWISLLVSIPCGVWLYFIFRSYRAATRELSRLRSVSRSPVFSIFDQVLHLRMLIRCFGVQDHFRDRGIILIEQASSSRLAVIMLERWASVRLNLVAAAFCCAVAVAATLWVKIEGSEEESNGRGLLVGALVYGAQTLGTVNMAGMQFVKTESFMTSVERLEKLADTPAEDDSPVEGGAELQLGANDRSTPSQRIANDWPTEGRLELANLRLRYSAGAPLSLRGISLKVEPREKIGICGRSGAGKSSLVYALLRLVDYEDDSRVWLDGRELSSLTRAHVRAAFGLVPQQPLVFAGSLRTNLDPAHEFDDAALWKALERGQMVSCVRRWKMGLGEDLTNAPLSYGERQLLSVVRVLLRKHRVLLCDEATSSADYATDQAVQSALHAAFVDTTVLTIAHRLDTIIGYSDRIVVLDGGLVAESGTPTELLSSGASLLSRMMHSSPESAVATKACASKPATKAAV